MSNHTNDRAFCTEEVRGDTAEALASTQFLDLLAGFISKRISEDSVRLSELTRALTLTRATEGFEPVVRNAIRHFSEIRSEVIRFREQSGIPESLRADILAGFERLLANAREDLELLSVRVKEVPIGTKLDPSKHHVVKRFATASRDRLQTVARSVMPEFSWRTPFGETRFEPAEVWAFTALRESEDTQVDSSTNGQKKLATK